MQASAAGDEEQSHLSSRHLAFLLLIDLIWGFNLVASKIGVDQFSPLLFSGLRFLLVSVLLLPMLRWFPGQMRLLIPVAIANGALTFSLLFWGLSQAKDVSAVAVATQLGVPFSTLLSVWLLGEKIRWRRKLGITLAFTGVVIISSDPRVFSYWFALAIIVASTFVGSLGLIYLKRLQGVAPLQLQAWVSTTSWPLLFLLSFMFESGQQASVMNATWEGWSALLFTAIMSSLVAHTGLYYLLNRYPVTSVTPLTLLAPIFSIFFGLIFIDGMERLTLKLVIGAAITLVGVFIIASRQKSLIDTGT
jgi:O-acetylserine/cysteine efflux transporter